MTFEQAVEKISKKFLKRAGNIGDFNAEVSLTDADCGGVFSIRVTNGKVAVEPYEYHDCDVRIICTYDNFLKFISDEESTYDMHCNSTRFADILAVVRKGAKSAKKTAEPKSDKVDEKPAELELKQESAATDSKKESVKKETSEKNESANETKPVKRARCAANTTKSTKAASTKSTKAASTKRAVKSKKATDEEVPAESLSESSADVPQKDKK